MEGTIDLPGDVQSGRLPTLSVKPASFLKVSRKIGFLGECVGLLSMGKLFLAPARIDLCLCHCAESPVGVGGDTATFGEVSAV